MIFCRQFPAESLSSALFTLFSRPGKNLKLEKARKNVPKTNSVKNSKIQLANYKYDDNDNIDDNILCAYLYYEIC